MRTQIPLRKLHFSKAKKQSRGCPPGARANFLTLSWETLPMEAQGTNSCNGVISDVWDLDLTRPFLIMYQNPTPPQIAPSPTEDEKAMIRVSTLS